MAIGSHRLEYDVVQGWERLPEGWAFIEVVGVAVDSGERVFVFCRGAHPLIVFDEDGRFVDAWGAGDTTQVYTKIRPPQLKRAVAFYKDRAERLLSVEAVPPAPRVSRRSTQVRGTFECS